MSNSTSKCKMLKQVLDEHPVCIALGAILLILAVLSLLFNEIHFIKQHKETQGFQNVAVEVSSQRVDSVNESKLVCMAGEVVTEETLTDPVFGISANVLRMHRKVEVYEEWNEDQTVENEEGEFETITIHQEEWRSYDNAGGNPLVPYKDEVFQVSTANLGAFRLTANQVSRIDNFSPMHLERLMALPKELESQVFLVDNSIYIPKTGKLFISPCIGDIRITYEIVANNQTISLLCQQVGSSFAPFQAENTAVDELQLGIVDKEKFLSMVSNSKFKIVCLLRLAGLFALCISLVMLYPLTITMEGVPFIGSILRDKFIFCFSLPVSVYFLCGALIWMHYSLWHGIIFLCLGINILIPVIKTSKKKNP